MIKINILFLMLFLYSNETYLMEKKNFSLFAGISKKPKKIHRHHAKEFPALNTPKSDINLNVFLQESKQRITIADFFNTEDAAPQAVQPGKSAPHS